MWEFSFAFECDGENCIGKRREETELDVVFLKAGVLEALVLQSFDRRLSSYPVRYLVLVNSEPRVVGFLRCVSPETLEWGSASGSMLFTAVTTLPITGTLISFAIAVSSRR